MTKNELFNLMTTYKTQIATIKFYDMADRYILTMGDQHIDLSDSDAENLMTDLNVEDFVAITILNQHMSAKITK